MQEKVDVPYPSDGAKVLVVKFNDYQCPPCKETYYGYEPILARYKPSDVKYLMKHFPLNSGCNPAVPAVVDAGLRRRRGGRHGAIKGNLR
jgi:protein-disulfide isomerase